MKRIPVTLGALSLLLLLTVASCASTLSDEPTTDACAISFMPAAETRAAVTGTSLPGGSSISVWGWYGTEGTITNNVFDCETVTESGGAWTYGGGSRYWIAGETYNFYAVYPSSGDNAGYESASYDESGNLTITKFDCTRGVDLMTASQNCVADDMIAHKQSVKFSFEHLLAYINVIVISEGDAVSVSDVKLYGINHIGNLNESGWQLSEPSTKDNPSFTSTGLSIPENDTHEYSIWVDNLLLLPETTLESVFLEFDYQYSGDTEIKHSVIPLKTGNVAKWDANTRYNYRINIPQNSVDVELTVTVTDWVKKDYTVIW